MNQKIHNWAFLLAGLLFISSCYQPVEGCLDPSATNFNASADNDCCCEYPSLRFNTEWKYDTTSFNENTLLKNGLGQFFTIIRLDILISDITPSYQSSNLSFADKVDIQTFTNDTVTIENNLSYLSTTKSSTSSGIFHSSSEIDLLSFKGGIDNQNINLFSLPSDHNLKGAENLIQKNAPDSIYALYCIIRRDTLKYEPIVPIGPFKTEPPIPNDTFKLPFYYDLGITELPCIVRNDLGNDRVIPILADLKKCFHSVDMRWDNDQIENWLEDHVIEIFSCNPP